MYIHVSINFNLGQHLSRTSLMSMHIYTKVKSSMDMDRYMSIINTMPCQQLPECVHTCQHWLQRKSSSCIHRQQPVCLSTFTTKSQSCVHAYMYVHSFIAFDVCTCQSSTQALCGVDNNLHISCHNSHRLYWHVYTCKHQLQPKSTYFVYKLYVYAHLHPSQIIYGHLRTCQHLCLRPFN